MAWSVERGAWGGKMDNEKGDRRTDTVKMENGNMNL